MTEPKIKLKPYPFKNDGGVNEIAAVRVVRMAIPQCSADPNPEIVLKNGDSTPNPRYTGEENCQTIYKFNDAGKWDVEKCVSLGHDPWHTVFRKRIVRDVVDEETGEVTDTKIVIKVERRLNVVQVSDNLRHSGGTEIRFHQGRGCRFLDDPYFVDHGGPWESPCEFRACVQPKRVKTRYGQYCSERHARLIAADMLEEMLFLPGGDPNTAAKNARENDKKLFGIDIGLVRA